MWVSATRTVLRSQRYLPAFMVGSMRAGREAHRTDGFVDGYLRSSARGELHTVTVWESPRDMRRFATGRVHGALMPRLTGWASEASYTNWVTDEITAPDIAEVTRRLRERPTFGPVDHPSVRHTNGVFPDAAPGIVMPLGVMLRRRPSPASTD